MATVVIATLVVGDLLVGTLIGPVWAPHLLPLLESLTILDPLVFSGLVLWVLLVPSPISMLGVSPAGLVIPRGASDLYLPWSQTLVSGHVLYVVPRRYGFVAPYRVTPHQRLRILSLRPT